MERVAFKGNIENIARRNVHPCDRRIAKLYSATNACIISRARLRGMFSKACGNIADKLSDVSRSSREEIRAVQHSIAIGNVSVLKRESMSTVRDTRSRSKVAQCIIQ